MKYLILPNSKVAHVVAQVDTDAKGRRIYTSDCGQTGRRHEVAIRTDDRPVCKKCSK